MQILPVGAHAVLVEVAGTEQAVALAAWARERGLAGDVVPGATTVLLDHVVDPDGVADTLTGWKPTQDPAAGPGIVLDVRYDGPDLAVVAEHWGCEVDEVADRHMETSFVSAFCGFAPGFAYLRGLGAAVPRLDTPRTRVPAGSVAVAGTWCAVYPRASPGGWQIIGHTDADLWDLGRPDPALLTPGARVRFREAR